MRRLRRILILEKGDTFRSGNERPVRLVRGALDHPLGTMGLKVPPDGALPPFPRDHAAPSFFAGQAHSIPLVGDLPFGWDFCDGGGI